LSEGPHQVNAVCAGDLGPGRLVKTTKAAAAAFIRCVRKARISDSQSNAADASSELS